MGSSSAGAVEEEQEGGASLLLRLMRSVTSFWTKVRWRSFRMVSAAGLSVNKGKCVKVIPGQMIK